MSHSDKARRVTFAELVSRLESVGLMVGVARSRDGHAITVRDRNAARALCLRVKGSFDRTASRLVLGMFLRETFRAPDLAPRSGDDPGDFALGRWPEFFDLWPELAGAR